MTEAARLKECPFCDSSHVDLWRGQIVNTGRDNGMRFVRCLNCGASTAYRQKDDAIACWNMRGGKPRERLAPTLDSDHFSEND